jgi:hypothetical protein
LLLLDDEPEPDDDIFDVDEDDEDDDDDDDVMLRLATLLSIMCALLVNTRFDNLRNVWVRFRDASASAGLSVFNNASLVIVDVGLLTMADDVCGCR